MTFYIYIYILRSGIIYLFIYNSFFLGGGEPYRAACEISVPGPGIEPTPTEVEAQSPNHWTTREFLTLYILNYFLIDAFVAFWGLLHCTLNTRPVKCFVFPIFNYFVQPS